MDTTKPTEPNQTKITLQGSHFPGFAKEPVLNKYKNVDNQTHFPENTILNSFKMFGKYLKKRISAFTSISLELVLSID